MTKPKLPQHASPPRLKVWRRWLVTCLILVHLGSVGLTYATNWRRSAIQDRVLVWLQPYLIGANWYQEMLPIDWISEANKAHRSRVSIQTKETNEQWKPVLDTGAGGLGLEKSKRLVQILTELAVNEDTQGLTNILSSIVLHLERWPTPNTLSILKIRLERFAAAQSDSEPESVLYEASLARFPNGEFGIVPTIEHNRSVRALKTQRNAK